MKRNMVDKVAIWKLPGEVLLHMLKGLHIKDILSMRTVHPYFRDLIDSNGNIWSTANFADSWPNTANLYHFETAAEMGNIEALVKLALAYLYKEGVSEDCEGNGETDYDTKAAQMFCKVENLTTNIDPFTWLFIRPPWSVNSACSKKCVFNKMKQYIQQTGDINVEVCVAKTMLLLEDDNDAGTKAAIEHLRKATQLGSAVASYLHWQLTHANKVPDRAEELDCIRQLREIARMGHIEAKLTLCKYYASAKYGGISRKQAAKFVKEFIATVPPSNLRKDLQVTKELSSSMRYILIDWLVEVAGMKGFSNKTLHVAVSIIDRYLKVHKVPLFKLQLLGVAVMVLCSRFMGRDIITIREAAWLTDNTYKYGDVVRMMGEITATLKGNFRVTTSLDFVEVFAVLGSLGKKTSCLAEYICELTLLQAEMSQYSPGEIAASAVLLAKLLVHCNDKPWSKEMQEFTGYSVEALSRCAFHIHEKCFLEGSVVDHREVTLQSVKQRYAEDEFYKVSEIEIISYEELCQHLGVREHIVQGVDVMVKFRNNDELIVCPSKKNTQRYIDDHSMKDRGDKCIAESSSLQNASMQSEYDMSETRFGHESDDCRKTEHDFRILELKNNTNLAGTLSYSATVIEENLLKTRDSVTSSTSKSFVCKSNAPSKCTISRRSGTYMSVKKTCKRKYKK